MADQLFNMENQENLCAAYEENEGLSDFENDNPDESDGPTYCIACVQRRFEMALDSEDNFPVKMGPSDEVPLSLSQFADRLPADLVRRFREARRMYRIAPQRRIRCPHPRLDDNRAPTQERCDTFIGDRGEFTPQVDHQWAECPSCERLVCIRCGRGVPVEEACVRTRDMEDFEASRSSDDRGRGFQICPHCDRMLAHRDACYEML